MGPVQGSLRSSAHVPLSQMMKPAWKRAFTVLGLTAAVATTLGAGYAVLNTEFNRLVPATVTVRSLAESADVNGDGIVDGTDLEIVARNLNTSPPGDPRADVDGNGRVGLPDLAFVALHFYPPPPTPVPTNTPPPPTVQSNIVNFTLETRSVIIGTRVTWVQQDSTTHSTTSGAPGNPSGVWNSPDLNKGGTFAHVFNTVGPFPYYCRFHSFMTGTITVTQ